MFLEAVAMFVVFNGFPLFSNNLQGECLNSGIGQYWSMSVVMDAFYFMNRT